MKSHYWLLVHHGSGVHESEVRNGLCGTVGVEFVEVHVVVRASSLTKSVYSLKIGFL